MKKVGLLSLAILFVLGCGGKQAVECEVPSVNTGLDIQNLGITEYCDPMNKHMLLLQDGAVFVGNEESGGAQNEEGLETSEDDKTDKDETDTHYGTSYQLYYEEFESEGSGKAGCVKKLFQLTDCYLLGLDVRLEVNTEWTLVGLLIRENGYVIEEYQQDGRIVNSILCDDVLPLEVFPTAIKVLPKGAYELQAEGESYRVSKEGNWQESVPITQLENFTGTLIVSKDGAIYGVTREGIYPVEEMKLCEKPIIEPRTLGIPVYTICGIYREGQKLSLLQAFQTEEVSKVRLLRLSLDEMGLPMQDAGIVNYAGKQTITIYCPYGELGRLMLDPIIIDGFNLENDTYFVQIEEGSQEKKNTDLMREDSPDLLLELVNSTLSGYVKNGYLENMIPYLQQRGLYEDLIPQVLEMYQNDMNELFSLPQTLYFQSIALPKSKAEGMESWTVGEFLQWVDDHPSLATSKNELLTMILIGNMEQYMDTDTARAHFTEQPFKSVVSRINDPTFPVEEQEYIELYEVLEQEDYWFYVPFYSASDIAQYEKMMGEPMVLMGYPNDNHQPVSPCNSITTLSLLTNSSCKEGAMEFINYWLRYPEQEIVKAKQQGWKTEGKLCVLESLKEKETELSVGHQGTINFPIGNGEELEFLYQVTEEDAERFVEQSKLIRKDEEITVETRAIVLEEVNAYFQGNKSLDQVCDVIQSRVTMLLNE